MDHAPAMRLVQSIGDLRSVFQYLIGWERASTRARAKSFSFKIFQDEIIGAVMFPYVMQNANVGMGKLRDGAGFALEALAEFRILGLVLRDNFDGDIAVQATVVSAINFPHPPGAQRSNNFVRPELKASSKPHSWPELYPQFACFRTASRVGG